MKHNNFRVVFVVMDTIGLKRRQNITLTGQSPQLLMKVIIEVAANV